MVTRRPFIAREDGAVLIEGLLVVPILLLVMASFVELGFAMFQWNQVVKAAQIGARQLAVSDPILADTAMEAFSADFGALEAGQAVPSAVVAVSCGAGTTACTTDGMARLITGSDGTCAASGAVLGMCDLFRSLSADNVSVTYARDGLGYVGRPGGPVLSITVRTVNVTFDFLLLDALIGPDGIPMPAHSVTITSEDLASDIPS